MVAVQVWLGLGSNLGDRRGHLTGALTALAAVPGVQVLRVSSFHESELLGEGPPQGPFLNGVAELRTTLGPQAMLGVLQALEAQAGRVRPAPRNHPRPLDLDLLTYGDLRCDTRELVLPHPRWHERPFVTGPLRELGVALETLPQRPGVAVVGDPQAFAAQCTEWLAGGCVVGLVPTMGALHDGHRSLMQIAARECDRVAATIFVNPLQFGPNEDFAAYPRTLERDLEVCRAAGVHAVFTPTPEQMYEPGFCSQVQVGAEAQGMEGALRPDHFRGVATVVARLFALARPQRAYFGEKDAQQVAVVRRMTRDLGFPVQIVPCPIVREADGLARSSRNVYLSAEDRAAATVLVRALRSARQQFLRGACDRDALLQRVRAVVATEPRAQLDYVELRREGDLAELPPGPVDGGRLLIAAKFAGGLRPVRLLDNLSLRPGPDEA